MQSHSEFFSRPARLGFCIPSFGNLEHLARLGLSQKGEQTFSNPDMHPVKLDGKAVADNLVQQCQHLLKTQQRVRPHLAVILVGDNPASQVYVTNKEKMFAKAGFSSQTFRIPAEKISQTELVQLVQALSQDKAVHGILVQLPLPANFSAPEVLAAISPEKDVDGYLKENVGRLVLADYSGLPACTPYGVMVLLAAYGVQLRGKHALVVGRSNTVGKPMASLLLNGDATVTVAHSRTENLPQLLQQADLVIAAAGRPKLISAELLKANAIVVDVGIHRLANGTLCGDCNLDGKLQGAAAHLLAYSPVPGGVGPMTIAMLLINTAMAAWDSETGRSLVEPHSSADSVI